MRRPGKLISSFLRSLRVRAAALLLGTLALAVLSAGLVISGVRQADDHLERAIESQKQLELLILLSGRISDYALTAVNATANPAQGRSRLATATGQVNAVFDLLDASIETQVNQLKDPEEKNSEATEGLGIARMRAMLQNLDHEIYAVLESGKAAPGAEEDVRSLVGVFGISFTPLLSQAIERERHEAQTSRAAMGALKQRMTMIAVSIMLLGAFFVLLLYASLVRPLAKRLQETSAGAGAIAVGAFDTRLTLKGHDELTLLMAKFNRMASAFDRRQSALHAQQAQLQETIDARTAELRTLNQRLNAIDQNRRRFFMDVSHELRTPLTVIRGEAEMTLRARGLDLPPDARKSLETIAARSIRLNRRVDDLLRVARSERGELDLVLATVDASDILAEAVDDVAPLARQKQIEMTVERASFPLPCLGDKDWLRQVIGGLIVNAVKYSPPAHRVFARASRSEGEAVIEITDEGRGISDAEIPFVFDRFRRGDAAKTSAEPGHGVGLAIAKWVIGEHGGNIRLESPGRLWKNKKSTKRGLTVLVGLQLQEQPADNVRGSVQGS
jgi:signal transduction histidine kinase